MMKAGPKRPSVCAGLLVLSGLGLLVAIGLGIALIQASGRHDTAEVALRGMLADPDVRSEPLSPVLSGFVLPPEAPLAWLDGYRQALIAPGIILVCGEHREMLIEIRRTIREIDLRRRPDLRRSMQAWCDTDRATLPPRGW